MAHRGGVQIHTNKVIYRFLDDVKAAMSNFLSPDMKEQIVGEGEILEVGEPTETVSFFVSLLHVILPAVLSYLKVVRSSPTRSVVFSVVNVVVSDLLNRVFRPHVVFLRP